MGGRQSTCVFPSMPRFRAPQVSKHLDCACANCGSWASAAGAGWRFIRTGAPTGEWGFQTGGAAAPRPRGGGGPGCLIPGTKDRALRGAVWGCPGRGLHPDRWRSLSFSEGLQLRPAKLPMEAGTVSRMASLKPPSLPSDPALSPKASPVFPSLPGHWFLPSWDSALDRASTLPWTLGVLNASPSLETCLLCVQLGLAHPL